MAAFRRTWATGLCLGVLGSLCLVGGLVLLGWRLLAPEDAIILPPGYIGTIPPTPTLGVLGTPLSAPPQPVRSAPLVILPVSELPSPTPTLWTHSRTPSATPSSRPTTAPPATTYAPMPTAIPATATASPTETLARPTVTVLPPSPTPTAAGAPPVRIRIPRIGLDAPVVPVGQHSLTLNGQLYSQWDVPAARVSGWHQTSAPLGVPGNTVLNGHHNIAGEVFRYLPALKPGDLITLESATRRYHYVVAQTMTLAEEGQPLEARIENARWILPTTDERVTLITCWPYTSNTHRLLVIALPLWQVVPPGDIP